MNQRPTCYYHATDEINSMELCDQNTKFVGSLYLMCNNAHVLKFYRNPNGTLAADSVSTIFNSLKCKYKTFFQYTPSKVFEHFHYTLNFLTTEYYYGAAYSIRTLAERLIYDNYGTRVYYEDEVINSDDPRIEEISNNIKDIGFKPFIILLESSKTRNRVKKGKTFKHDPKQLEQAQKAVSKITAHPALFTSLNTLDFNKIIDVADKTSPVLHGRTQMNSVLAYELLKDTLEVYTNYFKKCKKWGVNYV